MLWWLRRAILRKTHVVTEQARIVYAAKPLFSRSNTRTIIDRSA